MEARRLREVEPLQDGLLARGEKGALTTVPWSVARVTRCSRWSSWRRLRQVSWVRFSATRISSRASQQEGGEWTEETVHHAHATVIVS